MSLTRSRVAPSLAPSPKITIAGLQAKKQAKEPITALTAYDYATARLVDEAGIDLLLVGDSLAMVVMGLESTLPVTVDEMLHHTRAARRGVRRALLVADMPYGSYQASIQEGVGNAMRFLKEAGAEAVKVEGPRPELVEQLVRAEAPVVGHLGLTPQSVHRMGGYKVQGKTRAAVTALARSARELEEAGASAIVLEGIPKEAAREITADLQIPTIGIGAGPHCDGQILVLHDLVNLSFTPPARFVRQFGDAAALFRNAIAGFRDEVTRGSYPCDAESYHLSAEEGGTEEISAEPAERRRRA